MKYTQVLFLAFSFIFSSHVLPMEEDGQFKKWTTVKTLFTNKKEKVNVAQVIDWHPKKDRFAFGCSNGEISIYDVQRSKIIKTIKAHEGEVCSLKWHKDGKVFASCSEDGKIIIWRARRGKMKYTMQREYVVRDVDWNPIDNSKLAFCSSNESFSILDTNKNKITQLINTKSKEYKRWVASVAWHQRGQQLLTCDYDGVARVWDTRSGKVAQKYQACNKLNEKSAEWSSDCSKVLIGTRHCVQVWNVATGKKMEEYVTPTDYKEGGKFTDWPLNGFDVHSNEKQLLTYGQDSIVRLWDMQTKEYQEIYKKIDDCIFCKGKKCHYCDQTGRGTQWDAYCAQWNADGSYIAIGSHGQPETVTVLANK